VGDLAKTAYSHNEKIYKTPALQVAPIKATHLDVEYSQKSAAGSEAVSVFSFQEIQLFIGVCGGCSDEIRQQRIRLFYENHGDGSYS
jgi:hypothetical protein